MFDRITFDSKIMGGRACIRGMRIPVSVIVGQIAHGATWDEVLQGYPDLERSDIQQELEYAAWLTQEEVRLACGTQGGLRSALPIVARQFALAVSARRLDIINNDHAFRPNWPPDHS
jgi:uncharacterized protein (DUF433 family)